MLSYTRTYWVDCWRCCSIGMMRPLISLMVSIAVFNNNFVER